MSTASDSKGSMITALSIEVIERDVPRVAVNDRRGWIGGNVAHGLLRLRTQDGAEGHCFVGGFGEDPTATINQIDRVLRPLVIGVDVVDRERLWTQISTLAGHGPTLRPGGACIDVALWDLAGKLTGAPIAHLLGMARRSAPAYATHPPLHTGAEGVIADAQAAQAAGFSAYKVHPGRMPHREVAALAGSLRLAVGDDMDLMMDPGNSYQYIEALYVGRALDSARFAWFEDPLPVDVVDQVVNLARALDTPVSLSDALSFSLTDFGHLMRLGPFPVLRGGTRWLGISGMRKACAAAEVAGGRCEIGLGGNQSLNAANLHVMLSVSNCRYYEHWMPSAGHEFGVTELMSPQSGSMHLPTGAGLGLQLDEPWIRSHRTAIL